MDTAKAAEVIGTLARQAGKSPEETAQAIVDVAVSELFVEVEKLASRNGLDLRDFALMPFGGGGPMLGAFLARELGMARVVAPRRPGVVSALAGLVSDLRGDFVRTEMRDLEPGYLPALRDTFEALEAEGRDWLASQGYSGEVDLRLSADMRYSGQSFEIEVSLDPASLNNLEEIANAFHQTHLMIYNFEDRTSGIEVVNLRLSALGSPSAQKLDDPAPGRLEPPQTVRVFAGEWRDVPLYRRAGLSIQSGFEGPAIVAQEDTTLIIPDGATASVDEHLNVVLEFGGAP
jgi:N-methylhydantoinase A